MRRTGTSGVKLLDRELSLSAALPSGPCVGVQAILLSLSLSEKYLTEEILTEINGLSPVES